MKNEFKAVIIFFAILVFMLLLPFITYIAIAVFGTMAIMIVLKTIENEKRKNQ